MIDASTVIKRHKATFGETKGRLSNGMSTKQTTGGKLNPVKDSTNGLKSTSPQKNLTYDEVKNLSDKYFLPCKNVYELHAEFNSMMNISSHERALAAAEENSAGELEEESHQIEEGIPLDYFLETSFVLKDKHEEI